MSLRQRLISDEAVIEIDRLLTTGHEHSLLDRGIMVADSLDDARLELTKVKMICAEVSNRLEEVRLSAEFEVNCEVGDDNKKLYTNIDQRKAATIKLLQSDNAYRGLTEEMKLASRSRMVTERRVGKCYNSRDQVKNELHATMKRADIVAGLSREDDELIIEESRTSNPKKGASNV